MLFPNQYYGYHNPRWKKDDKSRKKLRRTEFSHDRLLNSPSHRQPKHHIRSDSLGIHSDKNLDRISMHHIYNKMSPAKVAKKKFQNTNPFEELITKNTAMSPSKDNKLRHRVHNHFLSPQNIRQINSRYSPKIFKLPEQNINKQKDQHLKQIFKKNRQKQKHYLILSKKMSEMNYEQTTNIQRNQIKKQNQLISRNSIINKIDDKGYKLKGKDGQLSLNYSVQLQKSIMINQKPNQKQYKIGQILQNQDNYEIKVINHNHKTIQNSTQQVTKNSRLRTKKNQDNQSLIVSGKIEGHYTHIKKLKLYGSELKQKNPQRISAFQREIYLCYRMYYQQLKNMYELLAGKYGVAHCFRLSQYSLQSSQINQYRLKNSNQMNSRLKKLQIELDELKDTLTQLSKSLISKNNNDPYLKLDKNNFEPELISQIFGQIEQITQKINELKEKQDQNVFELMKWRHKSMEMIVLIGQLKGYTNKVCQLITKRHICENVHECFTQNQKYVYEIVVKFQDMPL